MNEMLDQVMKLRPEDGDVIAIKVPRDQDVKEMWDALREIRETGIKIVAFTDEIELTVIKDYNAYLLHVPTQLTDEQVARVKAEWLAHFPNAPMMVVTGAEYELVDQTGDHDVDTPVGIDPTPGMDTL